MVIKFTCPNDHPLTAKDELEGKQGKCPKCKAEFTVPTRSEADAKRKAAGQKAQDDEDNIVFLCPNGHKLNGPSSLAGKPGQCPHCGSKFRIPEEDDDDDDEEFPEEEIPMGTVVDEHAEDIEDLEIIEEFPEEAEIIEPFESLPEMLPEDDDLMPPIETLAEVPVYEFQHTMAAIFFQFWSEKMPDDVIELVLDDGILIPDGFAAALSGKEFGVFARKDDKGRYTITTLPWEVVRRVHLRDIKELPKHHFK